MKYPMILSLFVTILCGTVAKGQFAESLPVSAGDLVHIQVLDTPEMEEHVRVTDEGMIPLAGISVKVLDLTPIGAGHAIERALISSNLMLHPMVTVSVDEYATRNVSILGDIKTPGTYPTRTARSVLQVLTLGGGLTETADRHILISRAGTNEKVPYFVSNTAPEAVDTSVMVYPGDTVIVPRAGVSYALGDLRSPGGYLLTNNYGKLTVLELIARAGGLNHTASGNNARMMRKTDQGYTEIPLELNDMMKGKKPDMAIQPDDIVWVPFSYSRNLIISGASIVSAAGAAAIYQF